MRLCSLLEPVRGLAVSLMDQEMIETAYPGKMAVLFSEYEYFTLKNALRLSRKRMEKFNDGTYPVLLGEDKSMLYQESFIMDGMYDDLLSPAIFEIGGGQKGYISYMDKGYVPLIQFFSQLYGLYLGSLGYPLERGGIYERE